MLLQLLTLAAAVGLLPLSFDAGEKREIAVSLFTQSGERYAESDGFATFYDPAHSEDRTRVIILVAGGPSSSAALLEALSPTVQVHRRFARLLQGLALSLDAADLVVLRQHPAVLAVYPDTKFGAALADSVPLIGAPQIWSLSDSAGRPVTGRGVRVAVLDTGVDYNHPALGGCLGAGCKVVAGHDFVHNDDDPLDDHGHGTHVAGIIAADGLLQGVAPGADVLAYKVLDESGVGYGSDIIAAMEQALEDGAEVINLSLGAATTPGDPVSQAAQAAVEEGCVVVAAAGNGGPRAGTVEAPAIAPGVLAVAAADKHDALADFSGRGPAAYSFALKPDLTAPGVQIRSTAPLAGSGGDPSGWREASGTSAATPHVTGGAALLRQLHPGWTPAEIGAALMNYALDLGVDLTAQGAGRIDLPAAAHPPLLAVPGSVSFGLPLLDGTEALTLTVRNLAPTALTVVPSLDVEYVADGAGQPISPTLPVTYVTVEPVSLTIPLAGCQVVTVTLDIPPGAKDGYYQGRLHLPVPGEALPAVVPLAFTLLSRVAVRVVDESGEELTGWGHMAVLVRQPDADVIVSNAPLSLPATFTVPAGEYYAQAYGRFGIYDHFLIPGLPPQVPYATIQPVTLEPQRVQTVTLDLANTRPYWLDARDADGQPAFINTWAAAFRFDSGDAAWATRLGQNYVRILSTDLPDNWPAGFRLRLSDTPQGVSFHLALQEVGFSPHYRQFVRHHEDRWPADPAGGFGFPLVGSADQGAYLAWDRPGLDASTAPTFTMASSELTGYTIRTDLPGLLSAAWIGWESGGQGWLHPPTGVRSGLEPVAPGLTRRTMVAGAHHAIYRTGGNGHHYAFHRPFYTPDWSQTHPWEDDPAVLLPDGAALRPQPATHEAFTLGAGPFFPALVFDNRSNAVQMRHPLLASANASPLAWEVGPPTYTLKSENGLAVTGTLPEHAWLPSPLRTWPAPSPGSYALVITPAVDLPGTGPGIIHAGFVLTDAPGADLDPPQIVEFALPQRFEPSTSLTASWTLSDTSPTTVAASVRLGDAPWSPLTVQGAGGDRYAARIEPRGAPTVTLSYTVTDAAGNWLAWQARGDATSLAQVPVTLSFTLDPRAVPWSHQPATVRIVGALHSPNGEPLADTPAWLHLRAGGNSVGYVRDLTGYPGNYRTGSIDFAWTFVPADLAVAPGPLPVSLEFDLGLYTPQMVTQTLNLQAPVYLPLIWNRSTR